MKLSTLNLKFNRPIGKLIDKFCGINIVASDFVPIDEIWLDNNNKIVKFKLIRKEDKNESTNDGI